MIGGLYKRDGRSAKGVSPSGLGRSVNFISKYKASFKRKFCFTEHLAVWEEIEVH